MRSGYSSSAARKAAIGSARLIGMMRLRISSLGALSETARLIRRQPSCASLRIPCTRPTVETVIRSRASDRPAGSVSTRIACATFSKLSSGSPMPMKTTLRMATPRSRTAATS